MHVSPLCLGQAGFTPLIASANNGHSAVVDLLCQRGANIEARNDVSKINAIQCNVCVHAFVYAFVYACIYISMALFIGIDIACSYIWIQR